MARNTSPHPEPARLDRIVGEREVKEITSLSRVQRWRMVLAGEFPPPVRLSANRRGWRESDIRAWLDSRPSVRPVPVDAA